MSTRKIEKDDSSRLEHVLRVGMNSMAISVFGPDRSTEFEMPQTMGDDLKNEFVAIELPPQVDKHSVAWESRQVPRAAMVAATRVLPQRRYQIG